MAQSRKHAAVYIRWLNAFRKSNHTLYESIAFECKRSDAIACEPLFKHHDIIERSGVYAKVGLLIDKKAVFRVFSNDCWSDYGKPELGQDPHKLYMGRLNPYSNHAEAWAEASGAVKGIVVEGGLSTYKSDVQKQIKAAHRNFHLPVYEFIHGTIREVKL